MKSIIIFRHGKSDWDATYDRDHDRPLSKRGSKAAIKMGKYLDKINQIPDQVISSSATRTKNTAELFMLKYICYTEHTAKYYIKL